MESVKWNRNYGGIIKRTAASCCLNLMTNTKLPAAEFDIEVHSSECREEISIQVMLIEGTFTASVAVSYGDFIKCTTKLQTAQLHVGIKTTAFSHNIGAVIDLTVDPFNITRLHVARLS